MLYTEILEDGRTHTYSDTYKIRQVATGVVYDDAIDVIHHNYEETSIPLEEVEMTDAEFRAIVEGGVSMNRKQLINVVKSIKDIRNNATDEQALSAVYIYPEWNAEKEYAVGDRVQYNDALYKCLQAHIAQAHWNPLDATSIWAKVLIPSEDKIYEWEQPNSTNTYMIGDKVTYKGSVWICISDYNSYAPDVWGWQQM